MKLVYKLCSALKNTSVCVCPSVPAAESVCKLRPVVDLVSLSSCFLFSLPQSLVSIIVSKMLLWLAFFLAGNFDNLEKKS